MTINIEIEKNSNENNTNMLRRFTKKVQNSGILSRVRSIRFSKRKLSPYKIKIQKLSSVNKKKEIEELIRLGKMADKTENQKRMKMKTKKK
ncbi:MAG: hypothetical protein V1910_01910 [bacterium]